MYNPYLSKLPLSLSGSFPEGSTQFSFVLTRAVEGATLGSGGSASPYNCIWDCIWLKDTISCHGRRRAGGPWSQSKVLFDHDTGSSSMHMTRVFWLPKGGNNQHILTSMGDKGTL